MWKALDNPWLNRAGTLVFLVGAVQTVVRRLMGLPLNAIGVLLFAGGVILLLLPRLQRLNVKREHSNSPQAKRSINRLPDTPPIHIQADPAEQVFVSTSGKRKIAEGMVAIGLRLISIPLFNRSEHGASDVKAVIEVYPESDGAGILDGWQRPGVVFHGADPNVPRPEGEGVRLQTSDDGCLDRSHGRWRELGRPSRQEFEAGISQGLARGINFPPDRQRHLLDVLGQERPQTRIFPGWQLVRYPVEATTSGAPLQEGIYRLEITLSSPDFEQPALLIYQLEIPADSSQEGNETAPRLTLRSSAAG